MKKIILISATTVLLASSTGWTADDAEATIRLMGKAEAELPDAVTRHIALPAHLLAVDPQDQVAAVEKAEKGLVKAKERQAHGDQGQDRAAEMREKATESRANLGRSDDHPTPPEPPPDRD